MEFEWLRQAEKGRAFPRILAIQRQKTVDSAGGGRLNVERYISPFLFCSRFGLIQASQPLGPCAENDKLENVVSSMYSTNHLLPRISSMFQVLAAEAHCLSYHRTDEQRFELTVVG